MKVVNQIVATKQTKGLKALVISDLHFFSSKDFKKLKEIIKELENNHYDVIYVVGDIIDATNVLSLQNEVYNFLIDFIKILGNYAPTYLAFGSHDLAYFNSKNNTRPWLPSEDLFQLRFLDVITKLDNIYVKDRTPHELPNGDSVSMLNLDLRNVLYLEDVDAEALMQKAETKYAFLKNLDSSTTNTLLCHYPGALMTLYKQGLLEAVNVSVAGHNHNGLTQLRVFPLEGLLNLLGEINRGIITPGKSFNLRKTKYLRGRLDLDDNHALIINPAVTSLGPANGVLTYFNPLFYEGASCLNYVPAEQLADLKTSKKLMKKL